MLRGTPASLLLPQRRARTIAMVARRWGFTDRTHSTHRFRSAYGLTPSEWRRVSTKAHQAAS